MVRSAGAAAEGSRAREDGEGASRVCNGVPLVTIFKRPKNGVFWQFPPIPTRTSIFSCRGRYLPGSEARNADDAAASCILPSRAARVGSPGGEGKLGPRPPGRCRQEKVAEQLHAVVGRRAPRRVVVLGGLARNERRAESAPARTKGGGPAPTSLQGRGGARAAPEAPSFAGPEAAAPPRRAGRGQTGEIAGSRFRSRGAAGHRSQPGSRAMTVGETRHGPLKTLWLRS